MRTTASILHLDLDAFYASVEQRDKPSLRGKPVIVGGTGGRGVVATASYEARAFGVHSAMSSEEARRRCPHAAFLGGRFPAYHRASRAVMGVLREVSDLVEPLSLDEAFVDLALAQESGQVPSDVAGLNEFGTELKQRVYDATGGLTASIGIGTSKLIAKICSDLDKPNGLVVVAPGMEQDLIRPMSVRVIPGIGPATSERLRRLGVDTVADLEALSEAELVRALGQAHGHGLFRLARAQDDRAVVPLRESKSISVEDTYEVDHSERRLIDALIDSQAAKVGKRLRKAKLSGRTVSLKVRLSDFSTLTRSTTLPAPTDDARVISRHARALMAHLDPELGVRLLGVGVSGLADWIQDDLFSDDEQPADDVEEAELAQAVATARHHRPWVPGMDVVHEEYGAGWVWGAGRSVVTVRFETAETGPGPVRSFALDDERLQRISPPAEE